MKSDKNGHFAYKNPIRFISAFAGKCKFLIGLFLTASLLRIEAIPCPEWYKNKMAGEEDVLSKALADLNLVSSSEFRLKQEQEVAVRALLDGKDVLAVLPTGFGKSLIYQMFVRSMDYKLDGQAAILVISPRW